MRGFSTSRGHAAAQCVAISHRIPAQGRAQPCGSWPHRIGLWLGCRLCGRRLVTRRAAGRALRAGSALASLRDFFAAFRHSEAFSFQVATADQAETDRYWNAIVGHGGQESACGWCKDRWGISWQITPVQLTRATTHPDRAAAKRAFDAMMTMKKIDIAAIEAAVARR